MARSALPAGEGSDRDRVHRRPPPLPRTAVVTRGQRARDPLPRPTAFPIPLASHLSLARTSNGRTPMHRIHVIHENPAWLPPLAEALDQRRLPWTAWDLS